MDNISFEHLAEMTPQEVATFPPSLLADLTDQLKAAQDNLKSIKTVLETGIDEKYSDSAATIRAAEDRDTGTARIEDDGYTITANLPKRVRWDQKQLIEIFNSMSPENAAHYAKAEYKVDERKYTAAKPDDHAKLMEARTVETGKPTYKIEEIS